MPKYVIAFRHDEGEFLHKLIEMDSKESALRFFFKNHINGQYSADEEGYNYFLEDFNDPEKPSGNILEL